MTHACTVDVEEYYQVSAFEQVLARDRWTAMPSRVEESTHRVLEILDAAETRATFFVLGDVARRLPRLVQAIADAGHELGCHGDAHRLVYEMSPTEFRLDVRSAKARIEDAAGAAASAYRAPSFSIVRRSLWALEILVEEGFSVDSSIYPILHDRYGIPGAPTTPFRIATGSGELVEFPPTTFRLMGATLPAAGGGYFRLYPYELTRWIGRRVEAEGRRINLYVHPWEFDPNQPRLSGIKRLTKLRHYIGISRTAGRFERILRDFRFGTITDALADAQTPTWSVAADRLAPQGVGSEVAV